jgi:hypothetical protein
MFNNSKKIGISVALMVLMAGQVMAQTTVLGKFQLGKSTYDEVKAKLPEEVKITRDDGEPDTLLSGPWFSTDGAGYGIAGLKGVKFCFDKKQTLACVGMFLEGRRLNDIQRILSSKYRHSRSQAPDTYLLFKANCDYVYLYLPWDKDIVVEYMTGAVYRQGKLEEHRTEEFKKAQERGRKKALEWETAKERAKF